MKIEKLKKLGACEEALEWAKRQETLQQAWDDCERSDWLAWLAGRLSGRPGSDGRKRLCLCLAECARLALQYARNDVLLRTIEIIESWSRGEGATLEDVRAASAGYAVCHAVGYAAYSAGSSAGYAAGHAVDHAVSYVGYAAYAATRSKTFKQCADIVRKHYPQCPID